MTAGLGGDVLVVTVTDQEITSQACHESNQEDRKYVTKAHAVVASSGRFASKMTRARQGLQPRHSSKGEKVNINDVRI